MGFAPGLRGNAVNSMQLAYLGFKPYSCRRGGARHLFRATGLFDLVAQRGRWANANIARICIDEPMAHTAELKLSKHQVGVLQQRQRMWRELVC